MEDRRKIDKYLVKGMVIVIAMLSSFSIFSMKSWYDYITSYRETLQSLEDRVLILETIIPEVRDNLKEIKQELRAQRRDR